MNSRQGWRPACAPREGHTAAQQQHLATLGSAWQHRSNTWQQTCPAFRYEKGLPRVQRPVLLLRAVRITARQAARVTVRMVRQEPSSKTLLNALTWMVGREPSSSPAEPRGHAAAREPEGQGQIYASARERRCNRPAGAGDLGAVAFGDLAARALRPRAGGELCQLGCSITPETTPNTRAIPEQYQSDFRDTSPIT
eukprot:364778-Chlamydomonas_euryale.AAC.5